MTLCSFFLNYLILTGCIRHTASVYPTTKLSSKTFYFKEILKHNKLKAKINYAVQF